MVGGRGIRVWLLAAMLALCGLAARAAPPPLEAYGQLPNVEMMRLSPIGDKIAYVTVAGSDRTLMVTDLDGNVLHHVDCHDIKLRALDWADDDHVALTASVSHVLYGGPLPSEHYVVVALNVTGHTLRVILANQAVLMPEIFGEFGFSAAGGRAYGYFGAINKDDIRAFFVNLYRVDLDTGEWVKIYQSGYKEEAFLVDPTRGELAAVSLYDGQSRAWRIEANDKTLTSGKSDFGPAVALGFDRSGRSLVISESTGFKVDYRTLDRKTGVTADLPDSDHVGELLFDRASQRLIGEKEESDLRETRFFDPEAEAKWRAAQKAVGGAGRLISFSDDLSHMVVFTEGDADAGTWWIVDTVAGKAKVTGHAYPEISADQVGPIQAFDWTAADGMRLHGVLTLPPGKPAHELPLVVLPHGGPQVRDYAEFDWWAQAFASRGYAVFQPNFRGSNGYGPAYLEAGFGQWGRKMQTDISDGVAALAANGVVDPKRACIVGASYGGYAALAGVTVQQGLYRCAVSWGGVTDPALFLHEVWRASGSRPSGDTRYWRRVLGVDLPDGGDLEKVSPVRLADKADAPILLMYGRDDSVVPTIHSKNMEKSLRAAGKPVEVAVMPGEDHWLSRGATRTAMLKAAVAFVQKHNPAD